MKKQIFLLLLILSSSFVFAETSNSDYLYLASYEGVSFIPEEISAGSVVSMAVDIENRGTYVDIVDLNASLILDSSLEGISINYFIEEIEAGSTKKLVFSFKVGENTLPGHYNSTLNLTYYRLDKEVFQQETILIPIIKTEKKVDISVSPSIISPGSKETLIFMIKNLTNEPISNLSFIWEEENNLVLPLGTDNKRFVSYLGPKENAEISYLVAADPNIVTGIYPIIATTTMNDNNGPTTQESTIGLIVGGGTDFEISVDSDTTLLSINIANIGKNNAESIVVKVVESQGISLTNNTEILGNLDRGDYTVASFETKQLSAKEVTIKISYTDTTGERQLVEKIIQLSNVSFQENDENLLGSEVRTNSNGMPSNFRTRQTSFPIVEIISAIAILVIGVIAYKKRVLIKAKIRKLKK